MHRRGGLVLQPASAAQLGGAKAFRLTANLKLCSSVNQKGTGLTLTTRTLTFWRARR